jgi:hypothetical protein
MMKTVDDFIVDNAMENSMVWLKKKAPVIDVVRAFSVPIVRYSKDKETGEVSTRYAPTIRMVMPRTKDGAKWDFDCVDKSNNVITHDTFDKMIESGCTKKMMFQAIMQTQNIWVSGSQLGMTWKVKKLKIVSVPDMSATLSFVPSAEDDAIIQRIGVDSIDLSKKVEDAAGGEDAGSGDNEEAAGAAAAGVKLIEESDDDDDNEGF